MTRINNKEQPKAVHLSKEQAKVVRSLAEDKCGSLTSFLEEVVVSHRSIRNSSHLLDQDTIENYLEGGRIYTLPARAILRALDFDKSLQFLFDIANMKLKGDERINSKIRVPNPVVVLASDLEESERFYAGNLFLDSQKQGRGYTLEYKSRAIILLREKQGIHSEPSKKDPVFIFNVETQSRYAEYLAKFHSNGLTFTTSNQELQLSAYVEDLDKNLIEVRHVKRVC